MMELSEKVQQILKERSWHTLNIYLMLPQDDIHPRVALSGLRSDGVWIHSGEVIVDASMEEQALWAQIILPRLRSSLQKAMDKFESYRNCECKPGELCEKHGKERIHANPEDRGSGQREDAASGSGAQSSDPHGL